jgi:glycosyltransferase involved in cell wall biosynthesis
VTERVGVVVPCKNEVATIERCLTALRAQDPPPARIVVVDNGSTDGSLEIARRLADEVLHIPDITISTMRNRGAQALGPVDVVAFVDADCEVNPGWVPAALEALQRADLVGWRSDAAPDAPWVADRWAAVEARQQHGQSYVWSQHLAIRAHVFDKLDGFDETLPTGEDVDLSRRVVETGGRIEFVPGMAAIHHGFPGTLGGFLRRERWHTREPGWFGRMSGKSRGLVVLGAAWAAVGVAATARTVSAGDPAPLAGWALGTAAGVPALGLIGSRSPRTAVQDGVLLGLWTGVRVARLPRELVAGRGRS